MRANREMYPIPPLLIAFDQQLIIITFRTVGYIHQYVRIA